MGTETMERFRPEAAALLPFTPAASKRLIGKGVAALPEVQRALKSGRIIIRSSSTNTYVAEELLGVKLTPGSFVTGHIRGNTFQVNWGALGAYVVVKGEVVEASVSEVLAEFEPEDVFIKGANAVDPHGHAGILLASDRGGTIVEPLGIASARGCHLIIPVGLEKLVPSVLQAARKCGQGRWKHCPGYKVGMMPVVNGQVITEIQAAKVLWGVEATMVAAGGIDGMEGAVTLALEGSEEAIDRAYGDWEALKDEPPFRWAAD